jgi:glycosyltransferase involved in cell wall biosynthesis
VGHVHGHRSGLAAAAARAFASVGLPFVLEPHGTYPAHRQYALAKRLFDRLAGERVVRLASVLVAKSEAEARDLPRAAELIPNGVAQPAAPPKGAPGGRLLFVGNDRPQKRGLRLRRLLQALPDTLLDVAGPVGARFRAAFAAFGRRVAFRGVLEPAELSALYASADLLVHPALGEAFGLVAFEAALCGTAGVVVRDHGCGEWYGRAGGATVPAEDDAALEQAVAARLRDPERGRDEARAVAAFAARELTWEAAALRAESLYARTSAAARRGVA